MQNSMEIEGWLVFVGVQDSTGSMAAAFPS